MIFFQIMIEFVINIGLFKNGKREGYAIEKYLSGNSYHGEFLNDERHG